MHLSMGPETADAESVAATIVDVRGIRRGMERIPLSSSCQNEEAPLGKSRRLMSPCIKQQLSISPTQFIVSTHTVASQNNTP